MGSVPSSLVRKESADNGGRAFSGWILGGRKRRLPLLRIDFDALSTDGTLLCAVSKTWTRGRFYRICINHAGSRKLSPRFRRSPVSDFVAHSFALSPINTRRAAPLHLLTFFVRNRPLASCRGSGALLATLSRPSDPGSHSRGLSKQPLHPNKKDARGSNKKLGDP